MLKEKISLKEERIRTQFETIRNSLNGNRKEFDKNPNEWKYLANLSHTENKLNEIIDFFEITT